MSTENVKLYPYRWVILGTFMLINILVQMLWICYAPVAALAQGYFHVSKDDVDLLANIFLLVYVPMAFPAAWAIDKFGTHKAVGFGAVLMGIFGLMRIFFPGDYTMVLISSIGIAIGQPFILSAFTKISANWFPVKQRATITGVMFLSLFLGVFLGEVLSPILVKTGELGISNMEMVYGIAAIASALIFVIFTRSKPLTPPGSAESEVRALMLTGIKSMLKDKDLYILSFLILLGSAMINGIFTLIDGINTEKHFTTEQGSWIVSLILLGGIVGSLVVPIISDAMKKRKPILVGSAFLGGIVSILIALVNDFVPGLILSFLIGFTLSGVVPLAFQYGAEITHPTPEGTSNGWLGLVLQLAGFLILVMGALPSAFNSFQPALVGTGVLILISAVLLTRVRESPEIRSA